MSRWVRRVIDAFSVGGFLYFMFQAIRWAFENEGPAKIAGREFDERVIVDVYAGLALACFLVMIVQVAPFLWRLSGGRLKPKSYRFYDLREEIRQVAHAYAKTRFTPAAGTQEQARQIARNLGELEIVVPSWAYKETDEWATYFARLRVLAEQRQYEQAKTLSDEFPLPW